MNKKIFYCIFVLILLINFSSAVEWEKMSEQGVYYDTEIVSVLEFKEWVDVIVKIKDTSGIIVSSRESIRVQLEKDRERDKILEEIINEIVSTLSKEDFQFEEHDYGSGLSRTSLYGNISQSGFNKLIKDTRVKKIHYSEDPVYAFGGNTSIGINKGMLYYFLKIVLIIGVFLIGLIIIFIKLKKKKKSN
jgi:hypothetical protein